MQVWCHGEFYRLLCLGEDAQAYQILLALQYLKWEWR